jgi:hypothetical protein
MKTKLESNFNIITYSLIDTKEKYTHWSTGLKMIIQKDGKSITLDSEEIKKLVESLPKTIGGKY